MAILSTETLIGLIKARTNAESPTDDDIKLLEDVTDTINDLSSKAKDDWKSKYEENDRAWRKRYTDRFNGTGTEDENKDDNKDDNKKENETEKRTYADLFKTGGK